MSSLRTSMENLAITFTLLKAIRIRIVSKTDNKAEESSLLAFKHDPCLITARRAGKILIFSLCGRSTFSVRR